jgi:hypothetical protein
VAAEAVGSGGLGAMVEVFFDDLTRAKQENIRIATKMKKTQQGSKSGTRLKTYLIFRGSFGRFLSNKEPPNPITITPSIPKNVMLVPKNAVDKK